MKILCELRNINGTSADIVLPDGTTLMYQWYFNDLPDEHKCNGDGNSLVTDLITLRSAGIKIDYE